MSYGSGLYLLPAVSPEHRTNLCYRTEIESRVRGPIASLNSLVEASPAKPRQLFAAAFRPKGRRTLSQSNLVSLFLSRAGRAGKPKPNSKSHRDSYKIDGCIQQLCGGSCFQTASSLSLSFVALSPVASPGTYVALNGQHLSPRISLALTPVT